MDLGNDKIAQNLIARVRKLTIATKFKQSLINDINKELNKANSIDESIDNNFIYQTEQFISECNARNFKASIYKNE